MAFFEQAITVLQTLVIALGAGLGIWGVINLSGLAIAAIAGILLNAILPGNDYEFDEGSNEPESASLRV